MEFPNKQETLKPHDLAVVLALAVRKDAPMATFSQLGAILGLSPSTVCEALQRLKGAGLVRPGTREPNRRALREFVEHGARYAFPPSFGGEVRGVPTAHSGPSLRHEFDGGDEVVWPDGKGQMHGRALAPLYPNAVSLPSRAPEVYEALTLVDAIRGGRARERNAAVMALHELLVGNAEMDAGK
jgi:DNA-binding transcriptional ArsR family regulator